MNSIPCHAIMLITFGPDPSKQIGPDPSKQTDDTPCDVHSAT